MKKSALFVFFVTSLLVANAQKISGSIKKDASEAASSATIALLKNSDSTILKYAIVKKDGNFELINIAAGIYLLKASHIGYKTLYVPVDFQSTDLLLKPIVLKKEETNLAGVTVSSAKPIIEVKADKTILNVEGTINATGNDGLELLRKSPGVMIDKDDNISLAGKNGVNVYIDGKPSPLSGADLTNYLKSLQSSQMESIEIITNPSAKYDAAGNAGIINIKLKKNKTFASLTNGVWISEIKIRVYTS